MKKLLLVATMVLGFAGMSFAQTSGSCSMTVNVVSALSISKVADLDFGTIGAGAGNVTLNPKSPTGAQVAGEFKVSGQGNTPINVSYSAPSILTGTGGNINFTSPNVVGSDTTIVSGATGVNTGTQVTIGPSTNEYLFWVGGTISVPSGTAAGTYTGTFTIDVNY